MPSPLPPTFPAVSSRPGAVEFLLGPNRVRVTLDADGRLSARSAGAPVREAPPGAHLDVRIGGRRVEARSGPAPSGWWLLTPPPRLAVTVDGVPVAGTLADPLLGVQRYTPALSVLGASLLIAALGAAAARPPSAPPFDQAVHAAAGALLLALGRSARRSPRASLGVGAALGLLACANYAAALLSGAPGTGLAPLWALLLGGSTAALLVGFLRALRSAGRG